MQLQFNLPEIDREKTKDAVERALETYRYFTLQVSLDRLPSITASYSLVQVASNLPSSSTEQAVITNIEYEQKRVKYINWIVAVVNRLSKLERTIIYKRYLEENELLFDYQIYRELNMSARNFYYAKSRMMYKLAFALKI